MSLSLLAAALLLGQAQPPSSPATIDDAGRMVFWAGLCSEFGWTIDDPASRRVLAAVAAAHPSVSASNLHQRIDAAGMAENERFMAATFPVDTDARFVAGASAMRDGCEAMSMKFPTVFVRNPGTDAFFDDYVARGRALRGG